MLTAKKEAIRMRRILIFDTHFLCHRAYHTTGGGGHGIGLVHEGLPTGVIFGVLRDIESMTELFRPDVCVFAFDYGGSGIRGEIYSDYKKSRREIKSEEEELKKKKFFEEVRHLGTKILPGLGYSNIFRIKGYEGDDIIAKIVDDSSSFSEITIISGDQDLFQLLRQNVVWKHPAGKLMTFASFKEEYGIDPIDWVQVKAIAGCSTDEVPGVEGVGEKTAIKYLRSQLPPHNKKFIKIENELGVIARNMRLVRLPLPGLPIFDIRPDSCDGEKKSLVYSSLGIKSRKPVRMMKGLL